MSDEFKRYIPQDILALYEVHNFRHAAEVLATGCAAELDEIFDALRNFKLSTADILKPGGNESDIPKRISALLRPKGWYETRIRGDLVITSEVHLDGVGTDGRSQERKIKTETLTRENFLDGHKVDYVKNAVAFDLEWNSKDQTFDRDLYAFRAFSECGLISAAILLTRSAELNKVFDSLGVKTKYGASTTWMGKLLYRLNAGRHGGCPVLVFGITPRLITDWKSDE
ncbi:MAG: BglII/BstYI family type II restriction endonuclease [Sulfuricellaceae bacterium]|nr:BglII/BstYI family type II restriction endonuclease [Sulfuricellaceae bacterium]